MVNKVTLLCACGRTFERRRAEYSRCIAQRHTNHYCSLTCPAYIECRVSRLKPGPGNVANFRGYKRQPDDFSPFRWFIRRAISRRHRHGDTDLSVEYLRALWTAQEGICPLTGWELILPRGARADWRYGVSPRNASLDRVDGSKGYIKGNVRFIAQMANYARHAFSDAQLIRFCNSVALAQSTWEPQPWVDT